MCVCVHGHLEKRGKIKLGGGDEKTEEKKNAII